MVNIDPSFNLEQKSRILAAIDDLAQVVTTKLDHLEQAIRELLQIVCLQPRILIQKIKLSKQELAWVSTNESASFKRLSWITVSAAYLFWGPCQLTNTALPVCFSTPDVCIGKSCYSTRICRAWNFG